MLLEVGWLRGKGRGPYQLTGEERTYYYLGYYLSDCPKLQYKGRFKPSEILDLEDCHWKPLLDDAGDNDER